MTEENTKQPREEEQLAAIEVLTSDEETPTECFISDQQLEELTALANEVNATNFDTLELAKEAEEKTIKTQTQILHTLCMVKKEALAGMQWVNKEIEKEQEKQNSEKADHVSTSNNDILLQLSTTPVRHMNYCRTQINSDIFHYIWEIDRFYDIQKVVKQLNSVLSDTPLYELSLKICNKSESDKDSESSNLELTESSDLTDLTLLLLTESEFVGSCSVSFSNASGNITKNTVSGRMTNNTVLCKHIAASVTNWHELTIECTLEVFHQVVNKSIRNSPISFSDIVNLKSSSLECLTLDKKSINFIINEEFHSMPLNLLMTLDSNYFKKLCDKYEEDGTNEIVIDENPIVFKEMLSYIKTGLISKVHNFNTLQDLLILAYKYDVQDLKKQCEYYLIHFIQKTNIIQFIKLAILYDAKDLKQHTAHFIKFYQTDIMNGKEFQLLPQNISSQIITLVNKIKMDENVKCVEDL